MFKNHPKGLIVAFFTNMGERFGFYTMMACLVFFLQARYGLSADKAGDYYSWFYFLIYGLALVGGFFADNFGKLYPAGDGDEGADKKSHHGERNFFPDPAHLANIPPPRGNQDGTRAEE